MMGQATFVELINATPYDWYVVASNTYAVQWTFGAVGSIAVPAGTVQQAYVEFDDGIYAADDAADILLGIGAPEVSPAFWLQARGNPNGPHLQVQFGPATPGNPTGSILNLGFRNGANPNLSNQSGPCTFILSGRLGNLHSSNPPGASWMQDNLSMWGGRILRQLCMPGSHDSGMSTIGSCAAGASAGNTQTQLLGILGQLQAGVRWFDIRPVISDGTFVTGHYGWVDALKATAGCNGQSIYSIIDDINNFTSSHSELVILSLSADMNTDVAQPFRSLTQDEWNSLLSVLQRINRLYVNPGPVDPNFDLSQLPLNSYIEDGNAAVVVIVDPSDGNLKGKVLGSYFGQGFYYPSNLPIYFNYADSDDLDTMASDQVQKMRAQRTSPDSQMFGLYWTLTQTSAEAFFTYPTIWQFGAWANPWIGSKLWPCITKQCFPNILCTDSVVPGFPTTALAIAINDFVGE
jgi:hypothetical protein